MTNQRISVDEVTPLLSEGSSPSDLNSTLKAAPIVGVEECLPVAHEERSVSSAIVWTVFPVLLIGVFLSNVVSSVVIATNQHIASEFNSLSSAAWLLTAYTLAQAASQPLYGKLSDIYGRRSCLAFCWTVFGIGCLVTGGGTSYWQVVAGRAISGVGSAGKIALTSVVVADVFPLRQVATYRAYVNVTATIARSIGGPIGAWIAGSVGWRWPFVLQLPIAILGLLLVLWKLPEPKPKKLDESDQMVDKSTKLARVDIWGAFTLVGTILSGMLALDLSSKGISLFGSLALAATFLIFLASFITVERYHAKEPMLPLDLICQRDVLTPYLIIGLQSAAQFGLLYSIPIYWQVAAHKTVRETGLYIVPVVVGNALGTIPSGRMIGKSKRYKGLTAFANLTGMLGFSLLFARWHGSTSTYEALFVMLPGAGMGITQSSTFVHLAASVKESDMAIAGTTWFLAANIGVLIGASMSTSLINGVLRLRLLQGLQGVDGADRIIQLVTKNVGQIWKLSPSERTIIVKAYVESLMASDGLSILLLVLALTTTLTMREKRL